jgi:L-ascorbate metabolism protein UlaG (beta-lactamase superfamily)
MATTVEGLKQWAQDHLSWFGQSAFRITAAGQRIFIDPYRVRSSAGPASLILVTHPHQDHFDKAAIEGLRGQDTVVVLPMSCAGPGQRGIAPGQTETIGGVKVTGIPSYNVTKRFHPKSGSWLGYVVEVGGIRVYHAGDTDPLPEMAGLRPDIALLPVGGMFTMNWRVATELSRTLGATLSIPMHFNMIIGGRKAGERFAAAVGTGGLTLLRTQQR